MLIRGLILCTSTITVIAQLVDFMKKWIASWYQRSEKLLTDLNIQKVCENSQFKEELNTVYDLRVTPGHIFVDGVDLGPDFCIKAYKFREVIIMSTKAGDFLYLKGKLISVTWDDELK